MAGDVARAALQEMVSQWLRFPADQQNRWKASDARELLRDAVVAPLASSGFVRLALLDPSLEVDEDSLEHLLLKLSKQIGHVVPQSHANNYTSLIRDEGKDYASPATRGHQTNAALAFHSDRSDLNLLLYVRPAARGGGVSVVPYDAAARELARTHPDSLELLYEPFPFDLREERIFDEPRWHERPVLWKCGSDIRGHYIRRFINDSQRHDDCPRWTVDQIRALDDFDAALERLRGGAAFLPQPGELVVLDNYRVMHARDRFEDADRSTGRLMIRTWVAPYNSEPLPEFLLPIAGSVVAGAYRGGLGPAWRMTGPRPRVTGNDEHGA